MTTLRVNIQRCLFRDGVVLAANWQRAHHPPTAAAATIMHHLKMQQFQVFSFWLYLTACGLIWVYTNSYVDHVEARGPVSACCAHTTSLHAKKLFVLMTIFTVCNQDDDVSLYSSAHHELRTVSTAGSWKCI